MKKGGYLMKKNSWILCLAVTVCCGIMAVVDALWQPPYFVKSAIKAVLFLLIPVILGYRLRFSPFACLRPDRKAILLGGALGAGTFAVIIGGYALLAPFLDLSAIPGALETGVGVTAENFLYVGLYIALCNSLLEEFFFRGFAFLVIKQSAPKTFALCFSAAAFAVYHAAIMKGWFSPLLMLLTLAALFACGLFFNWLDCKRERIWVSWLVHLFANLAINSIGMKLLGMF